MDYSVVAVVALVILGLLALFFLSGGGGGRKPRAVLFLGPCGGGKTLVFQRLVDGASSGEAIETVSSMMASECDVDVGGGAKGRVVDFPGHHRLRGPLEGELARAAGVVFFLDASVATQQAKPGAEILYQVLTSARPPPILFLCNKSDKVGAKAPPRVKLVMANELETLRKTSAAISSIGDDGKPPRATLGEPGKAFNFDAHAPCDVSFLAISGKNDALDEIRAFVKKAL